jgi:hypothetical protein
MTAFILFRCGASVPERGRQAAAATSGKTDVEAAKWGALLHGCGRGGVTEVGKCREECWDDGESLETLLVIADCNPAWRQSNHTLHPHHGRV